MNFKNTLIKSILTISLLYPNNLFAENNFGYMLGKFNQNQTKQILKYFTNNNNLEDIDIFNCNSNLLKKYPNRFIKILQINKKQCLFDDDGWQNTKHATKDVEDTTKISSIDIAIKKINNECNNNIYLNAINSNLKNNKMIDKYYLYMINKIDNKILDLGIISNKWIQYKRDFDGLENIVQKWKNKNPNTNLILKEDSILIKCTNILKYKEAINCAEQKKSNLKMFIIFKNKYPN